MYKTLIGVSAASVLFVAPGHASDAAANAVYERMQAASTAPDPTSLLKKVYAPGSTYLPGHKEAGIDKGETVLKMMTGSLKHLRKGGGAIDTKFRVVERKRLGEVYVDNGYMRTTVKPTAAAPEKVTYGKFITVITPQPEGHWAFVTDADSETTAANFDSAKPVPGLKFDL